MPELATQHRGRLVEWRASFRLVASGARSIRGGDSWNGASSGVLPTPAGGAHPKIAILFAPAARPDRTVFATNLEDGWSTMANCVAGGLRGFHVQVRSSGAHVDFPVHSLQVWRDGNMLRVVQVIRDTDRWEFFEQGPVQTFEHPDHYRRPRKRDRLTREHLVQYLRSLGWDVSDPDFWRSKSDAVYYTEERR